MGLQFYKKGQGYYTRLGTAIGGAILAALGCWSLYRKLDGLQMADVGTKRWIQAGVPALLFALLSWAVFKVVNMPKFADFLIATEGEIKKVSWSTRREVVNSTIVVIVTVFILATLLASVDWSFHWLFVKVGILKHA